MKEEERKEEGRRGEVENELLRSLFIFVTHLHTLSPSEREGRFELWFAHERLSSLQR